MSKQILKIHIFGQSGSGKGTQKDLLAKVIDLPSVSMGELLRATAKLPGAKGSQMKETLDKGHHVDNSITNELFLEWQKKNGDHGYIIEGYPRNREQFDFFEEHDHLTHAIFLNISDKEVMERITGRRICPCGGTYHMKYNPPKHNETCDDCGEKLSVRSDNTPEATTERIRLYHEKMEPLIEEYSQQGILHKINGEQSIEQVHQDILKIFKE